jgi:hypothetical protein
VAKLLLLSVLLVVLASHPVSAVDLQDLSTVSGVLSWMFNLQSIDYNSLVMFILVVALVVLVILAFTLYTTLFWIRMLSDALNRKFENENDKIAWVIVIIFTHGLGAMLYYKMVKTISDSSIIPKKELTSPPPKANK